MITIRMFARSANARRVVAAAAATALACVPGLASAAPLPPVPAVPKVDLPRYLGTWHQLAAIPLPFNVVCGRDTTATYTLRPDGRIGVHNACTTWWNTPNTITGAATVNDRRTGARLHVSFPGVPFQDSLDGPTNYVVTALAPDYSWAVVTDPSRLSGFVLARPPALDATQWRAVRSGISAAGENTCAYLTSPTTGGLSSTRPLCEFQSGR